VPHGGTSAFGRLLQYVNYYGEAGEFDCKGIELFLMVANEYTPNVEGKNSAIFRKEKFLKAQLRGDSMSGRGTERMTTNMRKLFNLIFQTSNKTDDIELQRRKTERLKQAEITSEDHELRAAARARVPYRGQRRLLRSRTRAMGCAAASARGARLRSVVARQQGRRKCARPPRGGGGAIVVGAQTHYDRACQECHQRALAGKGTEVVSDRYMRSLSPLRRGRR